MSRHVVIAGGGVGGLEAVLALQALAGDRLHITMLAPERHFVYRPLAVGQPFGGAATVQLELEAVAEDRGFELIRDALDQIDAANHTIRTRGDRVISYDDLILSVGAKSYAAIPGALTFRGPADVARIDTALSDLALLEHPRVIFAVSAGTAWTLPLYELALLTAAWAKESGLEIEILVLTAERHPLAPFGPEVAGQIREMLADRGIGLRCGSVAERYADGALQIPIEGSIPADLVIALPLLTGAAITGLPRDSLGFAPVDDFCRVQGLDDVFAIGDMAARPLKQGGLATQQADVAARVIAASAGAPVLAEPYEPVLRGLLFTGESPAYLRSPQAPAAALPAGGGLTAPWWPAHKIVGAHLAPYLASHAGMLTPVTDSAN